MIKITVHGIYVILNYLAVFIMVACCVVLCTHSSSRMQRLALLVCISLTMCCLGFLFRSEAVDADSFIVGQKLVYAFVTHGMFLMLLFILEYCKFSIPKAVKLVFHTLNFIISFVVLTLDHHDLFYKSYWEVEVDGYCVLEKEYGFMHTVAVGLFVLYMAAAVVIAVAFSIKNIKKRSKYVWRLLIAVMLPCIAYIIPKITDTNNDLQPIAFEAFSLIMLYMIYENNLYDMDNIAAKFSIASVDDAFIVFGKNYAFEGCNQKAEDMFPQLKSVSLDSDIREDAPLFADFIDGKIEEYIAGDKIYRVDVSPIVEKPVTLGRVVKLEDITIERQYTNLLRQSNENLESEVITLTNYSYTDDLSGINNRRSFENMVDDIRKSGSINNIIVGCIDVNGLKHVNDTICHAAGDELIRATAKIIKSIFKPYGKVYRIGGDEFSIILDKAPENLENLLSKLEADTANWRGELVKELSVSYGFAFGNSSECDTIDKLLIEADKKMYLCKKAYYEKSGHDRRR